MKKDIVNLLFDLGNVIVDIDVAGAHQRLGALLRKDAQREFIEKALVDYECGKISTDIFINAFLRESERHVQALDVIEAWNSMIIGAPTHRLDMLKRLKGKYHVYLLSNTNALHLEWLHRYFRREHDITAFERDFFTRAFYSHYIGDRKPNASIFRYVCDEEGLEPAQTLFMDDMPENIAAASTLGFQTWLVQPGHDISNYLSERGI